MRELIIIGAGGFGREVCAWARQTDPQQLRWTIKGFLDQNPRALEGKGSYPPVLGSIDDYAVGENDAFICAIGAPMARQRCVEAIARKGGKFITLVHPTVVLGEETKIGEGCILCPYSVVSANSTLGRGVVLNLQGTVDHDVTIGDWVQINCHADITAAVILEAGVFLGSHASILPNVRVGANAVIGAGAVVLEDVPAGATMVGVPARRVAPKTDARN